MGRVVTPTLTFRLRSCSATFVAMMQTAHLRERDDLAYRGGLYAARLRTICSRHCKSASFFRRREVEQIDMVGARRKQSFG